MPKGLPDGIASVEYRDAIQGEYILTENGRIEMIGPASQSITGFVITLKNNFSMVPNPDPTGFGFSIEQPYATKKQLTVTVEVSRKTDEDKYNHWLKRCPVKVVSNA
jgi:hypothetical protein